MVYRDKSFLRGDSTPIVSKPATKAYLESPLWDNFGPQKENNEKQCSQTKQPDKNEKAAEG